MKTCKTIFLILISLLAIICSADDEGYITQATNPKGTITQYQYNDPENLLTDVIHPSDSSEDIEYEYDSVYGELISVTDKAGEKEYQYNDLHMPVSETVTYTGVPAKTITYGYNPDGSLGSITAPNGVTEYAYDSAGKPTSIENPNGETAEWSYDSADRIASQTIRNSSGNITMFTAYGYNGKNQLTQTVNRNGSWEVISKYGGLSRDPSGNLLSLTADIPASQILSGTTEYEYDTKDRITEESSGRNGNYTYGFAYDSAGNPTTFKGAGRTYNSLNQNIAYTFDLNGNPTSYKGNTLAYDINDNLTAYGSLLSMGYDSNGLRVWKENSGGRRYYLYAGDTPIIEMDSNGNILAANTFGANGLISRRESGTSEFYAFDPLGSVAESITSAGTVTSHSIYDAYGNKLNSGSQSPFGFGGQVGYQTDLESGLLLLTYRYYDPAEGRFLTRDPIGYAGGVNLYAYCGNNPVEYLDPSGLFLESIDRFAEDLRDYYNQVEESYRAISHQYYSGAMEYFANTCVSLSFSPVDTFYTFTHFQQEIDPIFSSFTFENAMNAYGAINLMYGGFIKPQSFADDGIASCAGKIGKNANKTTHEIKIMGDRIIHNTRKKAEQAARRAGKGEPINHPHDKYGPHFHPNNGKGKPLNHNHYYYPKHRK